MAKFLLIAMSLRKESYNKKLIKNAQRLLTAEKSNDQFEIISFNDYPMAVYNADDETANGIPEAVQKLGQKISQADAVIISTPEYNGGIPGPFKNAIDWVSRIKPMPWNEKNVLLLGASPGALGATRSLAHSRAPLTTIMVYVYPDVFGLPHANEAFDENDKLKDAATEERFKKLLLKFQNYIGKMK